MPPRKAKTTKKTTKKTTTKAAKSSQSTGSQKSNGKAKVTNPADAWFEAIQKNKKFQGKAQVIRASEDRTPYYLRRPTGVMTLDLGLGGGVHAGGITQVYGGESVGKTHLIYRIGGNVQRIYGEMSAIALVCTEIRLDKSFARLAGWRVPYAKEEVDHFNKVRAERGLEPFTKEEVLDLTQEIGRIHILKGENGAHALDLAASAISSGAYQLVLIESLGALITPDQEENDVGDRVYGGTSIMLTNFVNKIYPFFMMDREDGSMLETTVIGINQARAVIGGMPGRGPTTRAAAGAFAWRHGQLASIELKKAAPIPLSGTPKIGREVKWTLAKGKAGTHDGISGTYSYYHVPKMEPVLWSDVVEMGSQWGVDTITDLVTAAKQVGAIQVSGSWLKWEENGETILRSQGGDGFVQAIVDDDELQDRLRQRCLDCANLPIKYS
jgi:RecA/RadA recombinase